MHRPGRVRDTDGQPECTDVRHGPAHRIRRDRFRPRRADQPCGVRLVARTRLTPPLSSPGRRSEKGVAMSHVNTDKLMEDLRQVVRDAEELLRATAGQAGEKIAEVRARAEESLRVAKGRLVEMSGDLNVRAHAAADSADQYVRTN